MKTEIRIFKDMDALSRAAVEVIVAAAQQAVDERGRFLVALSGGGTPSETYRLLAEEPFKSQVDWQNTFVFWGDERCVPPDDEGSNYRQAHEILLRHVPIPDENILRVLGELEPEQASDAYAQALKRFADPAMDWPHFDLILLGMGEDGHTASLFPGSEVDPTFPTLAVTGHYQGRPANRITFTPRVINSAREVMFLATGEKKAITLSKVLSDIPMEKQYPAQRIHPTDGRLIWLVDESAASKL